MGTSSWSEECHFPQTQAQRPHQASTTDRGTLPHPMPDRFFRRFPAARHCRKDEILRTQRTRLIIIREEKRANATSAWHRSLGRSVFLWPQTTITRQQPLYRQSPPASCSRPHQRHSGGHGAPNKTCCFPENPPDIDKTNTRAPPVGYQQEWILSTSPCEHLENIPQAANAGETRRISWARPEYGEDTLLWIGAR